MDAKLRGFSLMFTAVLLCVVNGVRAQDVDIKTPTTQITMEAGKGVEIETSSGLSISLPQRGSTIFSRSGLTRSQLEQMRTRSATVSPSTVMPSTALPPAAIACGEGAIVSQRMQSTQRVEGRTYSYNSMTTSTCQK